MNLSQAISQYDAAWTAYLRSDPPHSEPADMISLLEMAKNSLAQINALVLSASISGIESDLQDTLALPSGCALTSEVAGGSGACDRSAMVLERGRQVMYASIGRLAARTTPNIANDGVESERQTSLGAVAEDCRREIAGLTTLTRAMEEELDLTIERLAGQATTRKTAHFMAA